jgi:hypothetical protein
MESTSKRLVRCLRRGVDLCLLNGAHGLSAKISGPIAGLLLGTGTASN